MSLIDCCKWASPSSGFPVVASVPFICSMMPARQVFYLRAGCQIKPVRLCFHRLFERRYVGA